MTDESLIRLTGMLPEEIPEALSLKAGFRGKQIFKWIASGVESFDEMTNLSKDMRTDLSSRA